jgi:hypothetical protein
LTAALLRLPTEKRDTTVARLGGGAAEEGARLAPDAVACGFMVNEEERIVDND